MSRIVRERGLYAKIRTIFLPGFVFRVLVIIQVLRKYWDRKSVVVESHVQECEHVYVPGAEDFNDFGFGVGLAAFASFQLHSLTSESLFFLGEVESTTVVGHIWEDDEAKNGYWH